MSTRFQGLFHPPLGVLFTFPSRYWFTIGRSSSLALEGGPPCFPQAFSWLVVLRIPVQPHTFAATGFSPSLTVLSNTFAFGLGPFPWSYNPNPSPSYESERLVWALPVSLATTPGISLDFFSSGY